MDREFWIKVASWALIILIAPFALEIAVVAEVVGVDVAVGMLLLYFSAFATAVRRRIDALSDLVVAALRTHADKARYLNRSIFWNSTSSCVVVLIGGSIMVSFLVWMPTFFVASQYM